MNTTLSIRNQSCPNQACSFFGEQLRGNVIIHSQKNQRLKCKHCQKTWVTHRNEPYYGLKSKPEKIQSAQELLQKGTSIRTVAKTVQVSPSTVLRWKSRLQNRPLLSQTTPTYYFSIY